MLIVCQRHTRDKCREFSKQSTLGIYHILCIVNKGDIKQCYNSIRSFLSFLFILIDTWRTNNCGLWLPSNWTIQGGKAFGVLRLCDRTRNQELCIQQESSTIMAGSKLNFKSDLSDLASSLHLYDVLLTWTCRWKEVFNTWALPFLFLHLAIVISIFCRRNWDGCYENWRCKSWTKQRIMGS